MNQAFFFWPKPGIISLVQDEKFGKINSATLPRINSYSTVFLLECWFSPLPIQISLPTPPHHPSSCSFLFLSILQFIFSLVTSIHIHTIHIPPPYTCVTVSHPRLKNLARTAEFELQMSVLNHPYSRQEKFLRESEFWHSLFVNTQSLNNIAHIWMWCRDCQTNGQCILFWEQCVHWWYHW